MDKNERICLISKLNYLTGKIEGLSEGVESSAIAGAMLDVAEILNCIVEELDTEVKPEL